MHYAAYVSPRFKQMVVIKTVFFFLETIVRPAADFACELRSLPARKYLKLFIFGRQNNYRRKVEGKSRRERASRSLYVNCCEVKLLI